MLPLDSILLCCASFAAGITFGALSFGAGLFFLTVWTILDYTKSTTVDFLDIQCLLTIMHLPMLLIDICIKFSSDMDQKITGTLSMLALVGGVLGNILLEAIGASLWIKRSLGMVFMCAWGFSMIKSWAPETPPRRLGFHTWVDVFSIVIGFFLGGFLGGFVGIGSPPILVTFLLNNYSSEDRRYKPLVWFVCFSGRIGVFYFEGAFQSDMLDLYILCPSIAILGYIVGSNINYGQKTFRTFMNSLLLFESLITVTTGIDEDIYMYVLGGSLGMITFWMFFQIVPSGNEPEPSISPRDIKLSTDIKLSNDFTAPLDGTSMYFDEKPMVDVDVKFITVV